MSIKYAAQKVSDNHWVLPRIGDMKVEAHAFLSQHLFDLSEELMWHQIMQSASYEGVIGAYLMPDSHLGYGIPVGGVVVTEDTIIQSGSGYDINCGVVCLKVPNLTAEDVASHKKRTKWVEDLSKRVALGIGSGRPSLPEFAESDIDNILRYGAKAIGIKADVCERQFIRVPEEIDLSSIEKAYSKAKPQLGSVGGGNHFIEMQVDKDDGSVWVMIHCGSRGYGWQTANEFFFRGAELRGIQRQSRERSWLRADEPLGKQYWAHHNSAANYAIANRHIIVRGVQESLQKVFKEMGEVYYEISHNLVQQETLVLPDGSTKRGFVHRKGATRAFPAGHPDLVGTKWEATGHPCLIPGSMYDGAAILFPKAGAIKSGYSVNHGSGRLLGRKAAKDKLKDKQKFIDDQMHNVRRKFGGTMIRGVVSNSKKTPLDECSHVYKDLDEVLAVLEDEGIAKIKHRMWPVANLKGMG